jgi:hypothetical protein
MIGFLGANGIGVIDVQVEEEETKFIARPLMLFPKKRFSVVIEEERAEQREKGEGRDTRI